jgi:hypothetical protein
LQRLLRAHSETETYSPLAALLRAVQDQEKEKLAMTAALHLNTIQHALSPSGARSCRAGVGAGAEGEGEGLGGAGGNAARLQQQERTRLQHLIGCAAMTINERLEELRCAEAAINGDY